MATKQDGLAGAAPVIVTPDPWEELRRFTDARIGLGHCGVSLPVKRWLEFRLAHARARDAVMTPLDEEQVRAGLATHGLECLSLSSAVADRNEYLTRPDKGRVFDAETLGRIRAGIAPDVRVVLYVADGLSSSAVTANAADILPVIRKGLEGAGVKVNEPFFVRFGRVATMDQIGDGLPAEVVCVLLGERPGLVTAESMSAYIAYKPTVGMAESRRTVLANIHRGGTPAVEAGAHIVDLIQLMLEKKRSGIDLPV